MASVEGNEIHIEHSDAATVSVLLNDRLLNLDEPVTVTLPSGAMSQRPVIRTIRSIAESALERFDQSAAYSAQLDVSLSADEN